ncbi:MAG: GNAT family N-acetyltransferase [Planctomycetota bacterium]|nr:MAG: GNAT family N-acetyltransferase [Planctomycetota bacterium]
MEIRKAKIEEFDQIFMLGYDVWGEDASICEYLDDCKNSEKYQSGEWYVLVNDEVVLSALIVYSKCFGLADNYHGIGSIATDPKHRKKGYASKLISYFCQKLKDEGISGLYLYSDIDDNFYKKLGFDVVLKDYGTCMINTFCSKEALPDNIPNYF